MTLANGLIRDKSMSGRVGAKTRMVQDGGSKCMVKGETVVVGHSE